MAQKVVVIGNGFVASHLSHQAVNDRVLPSHESIGKFLDNHKPDIVINCIGFCGGRGRNIDGCEEDKAKTFESNTILPIMLASSCEKEDIRLIQIGSGCIYSGESPNIKFSNCKYLKFSDCKYPGYIDCQYIQDRIDAGWKETDATTPLSTYSKSKYACDLALGTMKNVTTLRIRMPVSWKREPRNLLSKLISYKRVVETLNSVTFMNDLSAVVEWTVDNEVSGTYHVCSPKPITHSQILNEYRKYVPEHEFTSITPTELDGLVSAPRSNCIIDSSKIQRAGFKFLDQDEELKRCVELFTKG